MISGIGLQVAAQAPRAVPQNEPRRVNNLTLIDGKTFLATTLAGDVLPASAADVGLFQHDTRFLSHWELRVNGRRAVVLSAASQNNIVGQIELTTAGLEAHENFDFPDNTLHIHREQLLAGPFLERIVLHNFNLHPVRLDVEICFDADFMDVFQVRGMRRAEMGTHFEPVIRDQAVAFAYLGRDNLFRRTLVEFSPTPEALHARSAHFAVTLAPNQRQVLSATVHTGVSSPPAGQPTHDWGGTGLFEHPEQPRFETSLAHRRQRFAEWDRGATAFECSDDAFEHCLHTAVSDFFSLRVPFRHDVPGSPPMPPGEIIAAGIPWFATIFGRDSIIAGYQSLMLHPQLAVETLRFLARHQARARDDWRDAEPGKILHEMREGEMTRAGEVPHSPYYGSVDSTPLFLILLDEAYSWTGDNTLLEDLLPHARRALEWIDNCGDIDGDGFVEFVCRSSRGLENQGWKDSWDAYLEPDGRPAPAPLALCEVQGYCFDARYRLARLLRTVGDLAGADRVRRQSTELSHRFERLFWMPDLGYYAAALDRDKRPHRAISSNAGHLLWSRIIGRDHARQLVRRLMHADMFSGWGIRTLSADEPTFNPLSYHRGSIWPHDNALIAQGLAFYDFKQPLLRILTGLFQAAGYFRDQRLPELFVGVQRGEFDRPVNYPVSCSPQAWASGSWFLLLTAALGLRPNAGRHELRVVNPTLPDWLQWLRLHHLTIGRSQVSLEFSRRGQRTFCNVLDVQGERLAISVDFTTRAGGLD